VRGTLGWGQGGLEGEGREIGHGLDLSFWLLGEMKRNVKSAFDVFDSRKGKRGQLKEG
jgi:hypothetical protein